MLQNWKVNLIYWWRRHKDSIILALESFATFVFLPLVILWLLIMICSLGDADEDEAWCKEHGFEYPCQESWGAHSLVRKWKREYKRREKESEKEQIRQNLKRKEL